jgi:peptide/nickel transport system permease protein
MAEVLDPRVDVPAPTHPSSSGAQRRSRLRRFLHNKEATAALAFLVVVGFCAVFASTVSPRDPNAQQLLHQFAGPSSKHWLGTDDLGRDNLSRVIYGARVSMRVSLEAVALALVVALPFGLVSGYIGGLLDNVLMRVADAGLSFPPLVLALAVAGVLGRSVNDTVLAIGVVFVPGYIRLIRGQAIAVREEAFIEASRAAGTPARRIVRKRLLPHVRSPLIVAVSLSCGAALLAEAGLSFLGLGAPPPTATWGSMLREAYDQAVFTHPWQLVVPGVAIALTVLAFNTVGDGLRDAFGVARFAPGRRVRRGLTAVVPRRGPAPDRASGGGPLLEVRGLSVDLQTEAGPVRVVEDVSLAVTAGEVVGLVGESGSGKTVTSLAIMRLLPSPPAEVTAGSILFDGADVLSAGFEEVRHLRGPGMALVSQDPMNSLNPAFTIGDQVSEAVRLHADVSRATARRRALELLDLVAIPHAHARLRQYPHQLSGGMRQRVMIAMALSCSPRLLIADEPTTALDVTIQAEVLDLLRRLQAETGMAVLFVTHDFGVVADLCDSVAVMYAGQVVERSAIEPLFTRPAHPYSEALLRSMPQEAAPRADLVAIPGAVPRLGEMPEGCRFHPRCTYAEPRCATGPVAMEVVDGRGTRCLRAHELVLRGAR